MFIARGNGWRTVGADLDAGTVDDGVLTDGDTASFGSVFIQLTAAGAVNFEIQVQASNAVPDGTVESVDFQALFDEDGDFDGTTSDQCQGTVTDESRVINGFLELSKTASVEDSHSFNTVSETCVLGPDSVFGGPCDTITYVIRYQNVGTQPAKTVQISDLIPTNTTYATGTARFDADCDDNTIGPLPGVTLGDSVDDSGSPILWTLDDDISPGDSGCLRIQVTINPN